MFTYSARVVPIFDHWKGRSDIFFLTLMPLGAYHRVASQPKNWLTSHVSTYFLILLFTLHIDLKACLFNIQTFENLSCEISGFTYMSIFFYGYLHAQHFVHNWTFTNPVIMIEAMSQMQYYWAFKNTLKPLYNEPRYNEILVTTK